MIRSWFVSEPNEIIDHASNSKEIQINLFESRNRLVFVDYISYINDNHNMIWFKYFPEYFNLIIIMATMVKYLCWIRFDINGVKTMKQAN